MKPQLLPAYLPAIHHQLEYRAGLRGPASPPKGLATAVASAAPKPVRKHLGVDFDYTVVAR